MVGNNASLASVPFCTAKIKWRLPWLLLRYVLDSARDINKDLLNWFLISIRICTIGFLYQYEFAQCHCQSVVFAYPRVLSRYTEFKTDVRCMRSKICL